MADRLAVGWRRGGAVLLVVTVVGTDLVLFSTLLNAGPATRTPAGLVLAYAVAGGAVLFWQRRSPVLGYAVLWAHALGSVAVAGYRPTLPLLVGLYAVAAHESRRPALLALAAAAAPVAVAVTDGVREAPPGEGLATLIGLGTLLLIVHCGVFAIGRWARRVRERARAFERDRDVAAQDAVEVERARIAGELHDIVGHTVTVMTLQAAGARKVMRHDPRRAEEALAVVDGAGAQAMSELRRMLDGLRPDDVTGLRRLDDLVGRVRATGVAVTVSREGTPGQPTPVIDLVAYRVVQEALTNVIKHAGPGAHATVHLAWQPDQLTVSVTDDGRGHRVEAADRLSSGHGLVGLTDRVAALGGRLAWAPTTEGGFRVLATLPTRSKPSDDVVARPAG
jgi:signal transduction histidine kinase